jgi:hypothetical protein
MADRYYVYVQYLGKYVTGYIQYIQSTFRKYILHMECNYQLNEVILGWWSGSSGRAPA